MSHLQSAGKVSGQRSSLVNEKLSAKQSLGEKDENMSQTRSSLKDPKGSLQRLSGKGGASLQQSVSRSSGKSDKLLDERRKSSSSQNRPRLSNEKKSADKKAAFSPPLPRKPQSRLSYSGYSYPAVFSLRLLIGALQGVSASPPFSEIHIKLHI